MSRFKLHQKNYNEGLEGKNRQFYIFIFHNLFYNFNLVLVLCVHWFILGFQVLEERVLVCYGLFSLLDEYSRLKIFLSEILVSGRPIVRKPHCPGPRWYEWPNYPGCLLRSVV